MLFSAKIIGSTTYEEKLISVTMESSELLEIKELQRQELRRVLQECHGPKDLILDPDIIPILGELMAFVNQKMGEIYQKFKIELLEWSSCAKMAFSACTE